MVLRDVEADAVVPDGKFQAGRIEGERDVDPRRLRVAQAIGQGLLRDPEAAEFEIAERNAAARPSWSNSDGRSR